MHTFQGRVLVVIPSWNTCAQMESLSASQAQHLKTLSMPVGINGANLICWDCHTFSDTLQKLPPQQEASCPLALSWMWMVHIEFAFKPMWMYDLHHCRSRATGLVVGRDYCNFCGDNMLGVPVNICIECGMFVCQQLHKHGTGCIGKGYLQPNTPFHCFLCNQKYWKRASANTTKSPESGKVAFWLVCLFLC